MITHWLVRYEHGSCKEFYLVGVVGRLGKTALRSNWRKKIMKFSSFEDAQAMADRLNSHFGNGVGGRYVAVAVDSQRNGLGSWVDGRIETEHNHDERRRRKQALWRFGKTP